MGVYGSPETYPFPDDPKMKPKPPRPRKENSAPKPLWKRWWFWVCFLWALLCFGLLGISGQSAFGVFGTYCIFGFFYNGFRLVVNIVRGNSVKPAIKGMAMAVIAFILMGIILSQPQTQTGVPTKAMYDKLSAGMSYEQVCEIMGVEGTLYHESGLESAGNAVQAYYWGTKNNNLYVGFADGKLYDKGQTGLR